MSYPPLVEYHSTVKYRQHFEDVYCRTPIITFDSISVRFRRRDFNHCFFESINEKDDTFSQKRAERIDWIKATLEDPESERYLGWDRTKKRYDSKRRVAVVMGNYIVVITITGNAKADFITAFVADNRRTLEMIRQSPKWA